MDLSVAMPVAESNIDMLTALYMERLVISFFAPTGEPITGTVSFRGVNLQIADRNPTATLANGTTNSSRTGVSVAVDLFARPTGTQTPMLHIDLTVGGTVFRDILTIPVGEATISHSPQTMMVGVQNTISVQINGASGGGIPGVRVDLVSSSGQSQTQNTNSEGRVAWNVTPGSNVTSYTLNITRLDQFVQTGNRASSEEPRVISVGRDTTPPVLTLTNVGASNIVDVSEPNFTFNITMTDDVALEMLSINQQRIEVSGTSATHNEDVMLSSGDNRFAFQLRDRAGNHSAMREVIVRYTPAPPPPQVQPIVMQIGSSHVTQGGRPLPSPPRAPETINGRTMLPFRYLVETILGGRVDYVEETEMITAFIYGHVMIMWVNRAEYFVDGVRYEMDVPPQETGGHTLVPLRAFQHVLTDLLWDEVNFVVTIIP
jgi:hypothetical protein